jgi:MraZ protein
VERFIGNIDAKTDAKGRVFIPASFRKIMQTAGDSQLVLRMDTYKDCLVLYPYSLWDKEVDEVRSKLNKWDEEEQELFRMFVTGVEILEMDASGRILIPKRYLQKAQIGNEVKFVGMIDNIEIWSRSKLETSLMDEDKFRAGVRKFLANK